MSTKNKLLEGDFSDFRSHYLTMMISNLGKGDYDCDLNTLLSLAHGCGVNGNIDILYLLHRGLMDKFETAVDSRTNFIIGEYKGDISRATDDYGLKKEDEGMLTDEELTRRLNNFIYHRYSEIVREIVKSAAKLQGEDPRCDEILAESQQTENQQWRLFFWQALSPNKFKQVLRGENGDYYGDKAIDRLINTRVEFELIWKDLPATERTAIAYLMMQFDGVISSIYTPDFTGDTISEILGFKSDLFVAFHKGTPTNVNRSIKESGPSQGSIKLDCGVKRINDIRMVAYELHKLILTGHVQFFDNLMPDVYKDLLSSNGIDANIRPDGYNIGSYYAQDGITYQGGK